MLHVKVLNYCNFINIANQIYPNTVFWLKRSNLLFYLFHFHKKKNDESISLAYRGLHGYLFVSNPITQFVKLTYNSCLWCPVESCDVRV